MRALRQQRFGRSEPADGVTVTPRTVAGVSSLVCEPAQCAGTILYFHGGAYWRGNPKMWVPLTSRIASETGARVLVPDYALAPEQPFPAALHDAARIFDEASSWGQPVAVAGDSAGGGVAAALVAAAVASGVTPPSGLVLISPWLDLTGNAPSYTANSARDSVFSPEFAERARRFYLQGAPADDPLASPVFCDAAGFPPSVILCGSEEIVLDDSLTLTRNLALAGVDVDLHVGGGLQHVWPLLEPDTADAALAIARVADHFRRVLAR